MREEGRDEEMCLRESKREREIKTRLSDIDFYTCICYFAIIKFITIKTKIDSRILNHFELSMPSIKYYEYINS